jgi:uncharacterized RDD family membrane protein YckC
MKRQRHFHTNNFKRTVAMLIDFMPLKLVALFICKEFYNITPFPSFDPTIPAAERLVTWQACGIMTLAVLLVWFTYGTLAEASSLRGTFGKRLLRLHVCNLTGGRLTFGQTFVRNFGKLLSLLPGGLGFVTIIFTFNNRAWHDLLAKAVVIEDRD